ncbi:MAG: TrlF family AAA-like ATPase [Candidatus Thorarchaeota archaeon]
MSNGSTWNIWDFHLHTPFSTLNNQFGDPLVDETWDRYVTSIETRVNEQGIAAIGITDYFVLDGYKRLLDYQANGRLQDVLLLPNIEFRLDQVIYRTVDGARPKRLNIHVLLSPEISPDEIEENFLFDLDFVYEDDQFERTTRKKLKRANLEEFGKKLQEDHEPFNNQNPFYIGCLNAVVRVGDIKELISVPPFKGNALLVLAEEDLPLLDWDGQHHALRKHLIQMSHAVFSSNPSTREFCLGLKHESVQQYISEFKAQKPCIWGCDSHGFEDRFLMPDENRFCWVKSEVTWEGLKQILYEPADRVRIQEINPEPSKSIYSIANVTIPRTEINQNLSMAELSLDANPNLVAIIGGRGSGKTALLDLIASCFSEGSKLEGIPTSFIHRVYDPEFIGGSEKAYETPVSLGFHSGDYFQKMVGRSNETFEASDILYLTQNHFDEYSSNPEKLYDHIVSLVFEDFADERREFDDLQDSILEIQREIRSANLQVDQIQNRIRAEKPPLEERHSILLGEKSNLVAQIKASEEKEGKQDQDAQDLSSKLDEQTGRKALLDRTIIRLQDIESEASSFLSDYVTLVTSANQDIEQLIHGSEESKLKRLPDNLDGVLALQEDINSNIEILKRSRSTLEEELDDTRNRINDLKGINKRLAEYRAKLAETNLDIEKIVAEIQQLDTLSTSQSTISETRVINFASIMHKVAQAKSFLQSVIDQFRSDSAGTLENIEFDAVIDFSNAKEYVNGICEIVDSRSHSLPELEELYVSKFEEIRAKMDDLEDIEVFLSLSQEIVDIAETLKVRKSISHSELYDQVFHQFFNVGLRISYLEKSLKDLSMGERAIILLKILLALKDYPLLIDQPEEHLDNRYIFADLVPAFRDAKLKRQIFIATHNANLVVNTDAEQIVIAEDVDGVLSYRSCSLEDLTARDSIKGLLEGGDDAFRKREQKYGFLF